MCCFGISGVDDDKLSLLKLKGVRKLYIMLDNDEAGRMGAEKIKIIADRINLDAEIQDLPDGINDCGDLSVEQVRRIKRRIYG